MTSNTLGRAYVSTQAQLGKPIDKNAVCRYAPLREPLRAGTPVRIGLDHGTGGLLSHGQHPNKRSDGAWRARYRDEAGREHSRHFDRKVDAQRWVDEVTASVVTGDYVDPRAGLITFREFFDQWAARQVWVHGTSEAMKYTVACATFLDTPMRAIRASHIEAWVKSMTAAGLAPGTVTARFNSIRAVFRAAHRRQGDRLRSDRRPSRFRGNGGPN